MDRAARQTRESYEQIADEYARNNSGGMERYLIPLAQRIVSQMGKNGSLLDIGCGPGYEMAWFDQRGIRTVGVDLASAMLGHARTRTKGALLQMDLRALAFRGAAFDGVWWCASLLHLPKRDAPAAIRGARRVLKDGAIMMVSVQQGNGEGWKESGLGGPPRYFAWYQDHELRSLLQGNGFTVKDMFPSRERDIDWLAVLCIAR